MSQQADKIIELAKKAGVSAKFWSKGGKFRIYAKTDRKDMTVYLECDDYECTGAALKVWCNTNQHPNWIKAQINDYRARFKPLFLAYVVVAYGGSDLQGLGPDITEMVHEARAYFESLESEAA